MRDGPGDLVDFYGLVSSGGYRLAKGRIGPPELVPGPNSLRMARIARRPGRTCSRVMGAASALPQWANPGFFRMFAELRETSEIVEFASRFGLLHDLTWRGFHRKEDGKFERGEPIAFWRFCIEKVRCAVRLLAAVRGEASVADHFAAFARPGYETKGIFYFTHPEFKREIYEFKRLEWFEWVDALPINWVEPLDHNRTWDRSRSANWRRLFGTSRSAPNCRRLRKRGPQVPGWRGASRLAELAA